MSKSRTLGEIQITEACALIGLLIIIAIAFMIVKGQIDRESERHKAQFMIERARTGAEWKALRERGQYP